MLLASYAKINLFLEVLAKRPDSYHQIETLLCSVSIHDRLRFALTKRPLLKFWSNIRQLDVPENLVCRIARYMQAEFKPRNGIQIELVKHIPITAGLGGGSSNAACTIRALNLLWNLNLQTREMEKIASQFGSDIAFFIQGGTAWATGRGENLETKPDLMIDNILLVNPKLEVSSSTAYGLVITPGEDRRVFNSDDWRTTSFNRLEAGVRARHLQVNEILNDLLAGGAFPAMMSGSGPTCFGVFQDQLQMRTCQERFKSKGYWTQNVWTISRKEYQSVFQT